MIGWGLFKKVVIADKLAPLVDHNFKIVAFAAADRTPDQRLFLRLPDLLRFFRLHRYRDRHLLVVRPRLMDNFRRPYLSRSTAEFWGERWHISLAHWFRDYLYIPLGGSRAGASAPHHSTSCSSSW